ncbi:glycosyltransferase [Methylobacterium sp. J-070]|uniref:glycosyltransferase n=1 Tax=Methylobacterium sp. J-070 TaxID=2836650 RepID=UPI001FB9DBF2|nr:glycosyltransferase [Methylobacterium sp. J-070]MCJ2053859.1 glycosyltransferase [Methylobacterium sp. J-070]
MADPGLKIAHIITRMIRGGADENTMLSCNAFAERGHDVTLLCGNEVEPEMLARAHPRVTTIRIPSLVRPINPIADAAALMSLRMHLQAIRPDIIHTHTSKAGILGRAAAIRMRSSAVIHGIHILPFVNVGAAQRAIYLGLERALVRATDQYVSVSAGMRDIAVAHGLGGADVHHVVASGMDIGAFQRLADRNRAPAPGNDNRTFKVLYLANYEARKQHARLIDEIAAQATRFADTTFLLAGQGRERDALEEMVQRRGLAQRVKILGYVEATSDLIASADLCVYCSEREGLPRAIVQYCATGRPIVAFHLPGIEAVLHHGHNGYLCPQGDFIDLFARIRGLLDDEATRQRMADNAAAVDLSEWGADRMYLRLNDIYRSALRGKRNAAGAPTLAAGGLDVRSAS